VPKAADRQTYPEWLSSGKKKAIDHAKEIMKDILGKQQVDPPLTTGQEQAIEDILKEGREYYRKRGLISAEEWDAYQMLL
jgi:trimethylamine:corrinoid methyltransferase-like protein